MACGGGNKTACNNSKTQGYQPDYGRMWDPLSCVKYALRFIQLVKQSTPEDDT